MSVRSRQHASRLLAAWPWAVLGAILLWGAWWRFSWPLWPVSDADTWGYLNPALSKLTGGVFEHTLGRNFVYPGFLYVLLRLTGDFRAITLVQHALGLASGVLLWLFWRRWWGAFLRPAAPRVPAWAAAAAGLGLVAFYEGSVSNLAFEHYLRPEAIFPFFAILDLWLLLEFVHVWFVLRRPAWGAGLAFAALFTGALLYQLKPSFGLTLGCIVLPLAAAWFFPRRAAPPSWRARGGLLLAGIVAAGLAIGLFLLPEKALSRGDKWSTLFLPETLLTIHADLLRDQMAADLRDGQAAPYDPAWLAANYADLDRELGIASRPERIPFRSLGFNPDYLLYSNASFCHRLNAQLAPAQAAAFAFHFYRRAWESRPLAMGRKVCRQMSLFYNLHCPAYWPLGSVEMTYYYQKTRDTYLYPEYQGRIARYAPAQAYLDAARMLALSPVVLRVSPMMIGANIAASVTYLITLGLFIAGLAWAAVCRRELLPAGMIVLLAYGFNAGNCLTIAIVHSLYGDRYSYNQLIFTALAHTAALMWLGAAATNMRDKTESGSRAHSLAAGNRHPRRQVARHGSPPPRFLPFAPVRLAARWRHMPFQSLRRGAAAVLLCAALCLLPPATRRLAGQEPAPAPTPLPTTAASPTPEPKAGAVENSVVKIFASVRYPDPFKPWSKQSPRDITGSGAVIEGHRILTNAHVVLYASQIQVQANQSGDKLSATVEAVAPGIDLAVLKIDDDSFFDTHAALPLSKELPGIKDAVMVYGYPEGGTTLSITKGIVSRIEFVGYNFQTTGLRLQIDAAINPGNSGGPAIAGDHMMGLAFSRLSGGAENIGYLIPAEEIELFLQDIADGHYDGKPTMFDFYQTLENPALRTFLKADKSVEGVVVHQSADDSKDYPLKEWDVITKIADTPVDDEGMVRLEGGPRVNFRYMIQKVARDGTVPLTVVRNGKETVKVALPVPTHQPMLITEADGGYPSYFVYGPLAFTDANSLFFGGLTGGSRGGGYMGLLVQRGSPLVTRTGDKESFPGERLVLVSSPFFPHKLAKGYGNPFGEVVATVNGTKIKNLGHLVEVLRDCKDEFVTFEFAGRGGETMVFPRAAMVSATEDILTDNGVRSQGSPDMLTIWQKK